MLHIDAAGLTAAEAAAQRAQQADVPVGAAAAGLDGKTVGGFVESVGRGIK